MLVELRKQLSPYLEEIHTRPRVVVLHRDVSGTQCGGTGDWSLHVTGPPPPSVCVSVYVYVYICIMCVHMCMCVCVHV